MNRRDVLQLACVGAAATFAGSALSATASPRTSAPLPSESVYQLATPLTDQNGRAFVLGDGRGKPVIVSMFYTSCQYTCPMLIETVRATEKQLGEAGRGVDVLLVSFDPRHDSVAVLKRVAKEREVDESHWTLARTEEANVRKLAALLGVQYKALANGDFNHTTTLIALDAEGRIAGRTSTLGAADPAFVKTVKAAVAQAAR